MAIWSFDSTNIKGIDYRPELKILLVYFNNGAVYEYQGVDAEMNRKFRDAPSPGKFYHSQIKGKYEGRRLDDQSED